MSNNFTIHTPDDEQALHVFHVDFDLDDSGKMSQMEKEFFNELFDNIPNFAFGEHQVRKRLNGPDNMMPIIREAMHKIYSIPEIKEANQYYLGNNNVEDKYIKRGEFGELILYHLLHEYFGAEALISKIYFKDSLSLAPHGFDAVHVVFCKTFLHNIAAINYTILHLKDSFSYLCLDSAFFSRKLSPVKLNM